MSRSLLCCGHPQAPDTHMSQVCMCDRGSRLVRNSVAPSFCLLHPLQLTWVQFGGYRVHRGLFSAAGTFNILVVCWILSHCIGGTDTPRFLYSFNCWHLVITCLLQLEVRLLYIFVRRSVNINIPYTESQTICVFLRLWSLFFSAVGPLGVPTCGTLLSLCLLWGLAVRRLTFLHLHDNFQGYLAVAFDFVVP